jgi:hypothetical protein
MIKFCVILAYLRKLSRLQRPRTAIIDDGIQDVHPSRRPKLAPRRSQAEVDTFNRRTLTRFGIDANQFGASSCHKGATAALVDDRRQLFAYAGVDGDWNLGILTRPRGGRLLRCGRSAAEPSERPAPALR